MSSNSSMLNWVEQLQSQGQYTFTRSQAEFGTKRSSIANQTALRRLKKQGKIASPRREFFIIVPPEYRVAGSPPASWFIDDLMREIGQPYYVGLLSAAAIHGAAHQQPMVFQVMTSRPIREARAGKVTIQFIMNSKVELMPVVEKQTETGTMRVATPETTAFDLVRYRSGAGHLSNAAMVLSELAERLDVQSLFDVAHVVRLPEVQRLGYLLDAIGESALAGSLAGIVEAAKPRVIPLGFGKLSNVKTDKKWRVMENEKLEVDL